MALTIVKESGFVNSIWGFISIPHDTGGERLTQIDHIQDNANQRKKTDEQKGERQAIGSSATSFIPCDKPDTTENKARDHQVIQIFRKREIPGGPECNPVK